MKMEDIALVDYIASNPFCTGVSAVRMLTSMFEYLRSR